MLHNMAINKLLANTYVATSHVAACYGETSHLATSPLIDSFSSQNHLKWVSKLLFTNFVICFISIPLFFLQYSQKATENRRNTFIHDGWERSQQHWKTSCGFLMDVWKVSANSSVGLTWAWRAGPGSSPGGWGRAAGWSRWPHPFCPTTPASGSLQAARWQTAHLSSSTTRSLGM